MSSQVLSTAAPIPGLLILGSGMIGLIREHAAVVESILEDGMEELTITEEELQRLTDADVAFQDAQQAEREARQGKDAARDEAREWFGDLRERSRQLALHSKGAGVLQRVMVSPFPLADRIPEADIPRQVEQIARVAAGYLKLLERSRYTAEDLARGPSLAATLRAAELTLVDKVAVRRAASAERASALRAVVERLQGLDGRLGLILPETGLVKLASLRQECLPLRSSPAEAAADPADGETGE